MKKTFRAILTALFIAILSLGIASAAFAANGDIEWHKSYDEGYFDTYVYGGKAVEEGTAEIVNNGNNRVYFDFNVEKSGFYLFDTAEDSLVEFPETFKDNKAKDSISSLYVGENRERLYYLEKGKTVMGVYFFNIPSDTVTVEYFGENVADFTINQEKFDCKIMDSDILEDSDEFYTETDSVITFTSGKTLDCTNMGYLAECNGKPKLGKNNATIKFGGAEKDIEYTVYCVEDLVESAEISNPHKYTKIKTDDKGNDVYNYVDGEILTVNFKDGTKFETEVNQGDTNTVFFGINEVYTRVDYYEKESGDTVLEIRIADTVITEYEVEREELTFDENISILNEDNKNSAEMAKHFTEPGISHLDKDPEFTNDYIRISFKDVIRIFSNFFAFIRFYL